MIDLIKFLKGNKINTDKMLHLAFGGWIVSFIHVWWEALLFSVILGIGKELIDKYVCKDKIDVVDAFFTTFGGFISVIVNSVLF